MGEYSETGALIRGYVYPPGSAYTSDPVALKSPVKAAGQPTGYDYSYYQNDHLGTSQRLMQKSGVTVWQGEYDAFGAVDEVVSHVRNPLRFPGQYYDKETGLHQNYFRTYDPGIGRYIESDPIGLRGGLNIYAYVMGNPLKFFDPHGLLSECLQNAEKMVTDCQRRVILFGQACEIYCFVVSGVCPPFFPVCETYPGDCLVFCAKNKDQGLVDCADSYRKEKERCKENEENCT